VLHHVRVWFDLHDVVRPVLVCVVAIAVVACAMAIKGWHVSSLVLGGLIVVIAAAMVMQVHRATGHLRRRASDVTEVAREADRQYIRALRRIVRFVEARERYTRGHSERVGRLATGIARQMKLPEETCAMLKVAGELHDIGLLAISDDVLNVKAKLSTAGFRTIKKHADVAYDVLTPIRSLSGIVPAIHHHHERMNGTGYPKGLSGERIPLGARILAVADSYDAMTHDRPHRPAMASLQAARELRRCTPDGYDAQCVGALEELLCVREMTQAAPAGQEAQLAGA